MYLYCFRFEKRYRKPRKDISTKKHKHYSDATIEKAVKLLKEGNSLRYVAKSLDINTTVLHRHIKLGDRIKKKVASQYSQKKRRF